MIKEQIAIGPLSGDKLRRLYISLPKDYEASEKAYPVMYMFDGHNVFFDEDATYGKSWGMAGYLEAYPKDLIIVAVECNHEDHRRMHEYAPYPMRVEGIGMLEGLGPVYMDWLTEVLKPEIDQRFRTLPDRKHTMLAGSSMGGLMALYGVTAYNRVFSRAAALSPSIWLSPGKTLDFIKASEIARGTVVYMDYGSREMNNHGSRDKIKRSFYSCYKALLDKGVYAAARIVPDGRHSEASWEKQIPIFMACLGVV